MSRLLAFGSSPIRDDFAFTSLIADHLGREYVSRVKPVNSNHKMARMVLSQDYGDDDYVIVVWGTTVRHEFRTQQGWMTVSRVDPTPGSDFEQHWYQGPGQWEYTAVYSALKEMALVQAFLTARNIPYAFTFDHDDIITSGLLTEPDEYISALKSMIDWTRVFLFEGHGFLHWVYKNDFKVQNDTHAEPAAHDSAVKYVLDSFEF